jgi:UrcA family protein
MRLFLLILASVFLLASPAYAAGHKVKLRDLNLSVAADVEKAHDRILRAVKRACRDELGYAFPLVRLERACVKDLMGATIARINAPALTRFAASEDGGRFEVAAQDAG